MIQQKRPSDYLILAPKRDGGLKKMTKLKASSCPDLLRKYDKTLQSANE